MFMFLLLPSISSAISECLSPFMSRLIKLVLSSATGTFFNVFILCLLLFSIEYSPTPNLLHLRVHKVLKFFFFSNSHKLLIISMLLCLNYTLSCFWPFLILLWCYSLFFFLLLNGIVSVLHSV